MVVVVVAAVEVVVAAAPAPAPADRGTSRLHAVAVAAMTLVTVAWLGFLFAGAPFTGCLWFGRSDIWPWRFGLATTYYLRRGRPKKYGIGIILCSNSFLGIAKFYKLIEFLNLKNNILENAKLGDFSCNDYVR